MSVIIKHVESVEDEVMNEQSHADLATYALPNNGRSMAINQLIREKYSIDDEIMVLRKIHLGKITDEEFKEYSDFVDSCVDAVPEDEPVEVRI